MFKRQLEQLCLNEDAIEIAGEVVTLLEALELAVVMLMGDKTRLENHWYPRQVQRIESQLIPEWSRHHPSHRARTRRSR